MMIKIIISNHKQTANEWRPDTNEIIFNPLQVPFGIAPAFSLAHEIAHAFKGHRKGINPQIIIQQELEAWIEAIRCFNPNCKQMKAAFRCFCTYLEYHRGFIDVDWEEIRSIFGDDVTLEMEVFYG
jgi:hypothetical protein